MESSLLVSNCVNITLVGKVFLLADQTDLQAQESLSACDTCSGLQ